MKQYAIVCVVAVLLLLLVASQAMAYRLILIPVGDVLVEGMTKVEIAPAWNLRHEDAGRPSTDLFTNYRVDVGMAGNTELQTKISDVTNTNAASYISGQWMFLKEEKVGANVSLGITNLGNEDESAGRPRRSVYLAGTKGIPVPGFKRAWRVTLGAGTNQLQGVWGGAIIPVSPFAQFAAEYAPKLIRTPGAAGFTAAYGYNWTPHFRTKIAYLGGDLGLGVVYTDWLHKK